MKSLIKLIERNLLLVSIILSFLYIKNNITSETKKTEVTARIVDKRYVSARLSSIKIGKARVSTEHKEKYLVTLKYDDKEYSFDNKIVYDNYRKYDEIKVQLVSSYNKKGRLIRQKIELNRKW